MNKVYSKPLYRLREYLLKKWEKPKTKEEYIRKNIEFKLYNKILDKISKMPESEPRAKFIIKQLICDYYTDVRAYDCDEKSDQIGTQVDKKTKMPYLLISSRVINFLNGFKFEKLIPDMHSKLFNFALLHEYGHVFEYLKDLIENGISIVEPLKPYMIDIDIEAFRENVGNLAARKNYDGLFDSLKQYLITGVYDIAKGYYKSGINKA